MIDALSHEDPFVVGVAIYTPVGSEADFAELLPRNFKIIAQREGGFGARLLGATEDLFSVGFSAIWGHLNLYRRCEKGQTGLSPEWRI